MSEDEGTVMLPHLTEAAPAAPPEPTEAQCWEQLGRWGQAERELLEQLERVRGEYAAWLQRLAAVRG